MPPVHPARLDASTTDLRWNLFLALSVLCSLTVLLILAARRWNVGRSTEEFELQHHQRGDASRDAKLGDIADSNISDYQPFSYLPPPPGSVPISEPPAAPVLFPQFNSGALAAQAMAKLWPDPSLVTEGEVRYSWRRHTLPMSKATSNDETNVFITHDADQYFDDGDQNGFWRRRTLVFG